jgi:hypothetical protein
MSSRIGTGPAAKAATPELQEQWLSLARECGFGSGNVIVGARRARRLAIGRRLQLEPRGGGSFFLKPAGESPSRGRPGPTSDRLRPQRPSRHSCALHGAHRGERTRLLACRRAHAVRLLATAKLGYARPLPCAPLRPPVPPPRSKQRVSTPDRLRRSESAWNDPWSLSVHPNLRGQIHPRGTP